jgi:hypothetical protein
MLDGPGVSISLTGGFSSPIACAMTFALLFLAVGAVRRCGGVACGTLRSALEGLILAQSLGTRNRQIGRGCGSSLRSIWGARRVEDWQDWHWLRFSLAASSFLGQIPAKPNQRSFERKMQNRGDCDREQHASRIYCAGAMDMQSILHHMHTKEMNQIDSVGYFPNKNQGRESQHCFQRVTGGGKKKRQEDGERGRVPNVPKRSPGRINPEL